MLPASGTTPSSIRAPITPLVTVVAQRVATPSPDAPVLKTQRARNDLRNAARSPAANQPSATTTTPSTAEVIADEARQTAAQERERPDLSSAVLRASVARLRMMIAPAPPDGFNDAERAARRTGEQVRALVRGSPDEIAALVVGRIASRTVDVSA